MGAPTLTNSGFLAGKSAAATAVALALCTLLDIPDRVTAAFVATLCVTPGALMGLRVTAEQWFGSVVGGVFGTLCAYLDLPTHAGVPLAVGAAVLATYASGFSRGAVAAVFTALFLQIISFGAPVETFGYRLAAVAIAGLSAFVVNFAVSSVFYSSLFRKRLQRMWKHMLAAFSDSKEGQEARLYQLFPLLSQLCVELSQAERELSWRGQEKDAEAIQSMRWEAQWMRDLVHLLVDEHLRNPQDGLNFVPLIGKEHSDDPRIPERVRAHTLSRAQHGATD